MKRIDVLPDAVLLEIFEFYMIMYPSYRGKAGYRSMAIACSCMSTMEKSCFSITTSPQSATFLYSQNTRKGHLRRLATLSSPREWKYDLIRHGQRHCSTWSEQSRMSSHLAPCGLATGRSPGTDACAIPGANRSAA